MAKQTTKKSTKSVKKTEQEKPVSSNIDKNPPEFATKYQELISDEKPGFDITLLNAAIQKSLNKSIFKIFKCQLISFWSKGVKIVSLTETSNKNHKIDLVFNPEDKDADIFEKGKNYKLEISEI